MQVKAHIRASVRRRLERGGDAPRTHGEVARIAGVTVDQVREHYPHVGHIVTAARKLGKPRRFRAVQRQLLLEAAWEWVRANGYGGLTLQATADAFGCSYNGVRNYWANRRLLIADLVATAEARGELALAEAGREVLK